ncbi:MAG TPA: histidine phosphatase family protein, partial [Ardenticatenaceae bacterium]|nr:histidine phosphatase family protein [Ardenticatenaceae bacterium]
LDAVGEVNFGQWQGRALKDLEKEDLWRVVQAYPSVVCFPGGESFLAAQARAVYSVEMIAATLQPEQAAIVVSHSDIIKAIVAYYAGMHLDQFQRLVVNPASITIIGLTPFRPAILRLNDDSHLPEPEPAPQESPATTEA